MWSSQKSGAHKKNALGIRVIGAPPLSGSPTPRTPHERSFVPWHTELSTRIVPSGCFTQPDQRPN